MDNNMLRQSNFKREKFELINLMNRFFLMVITCCIFCHDNVAAPALGKPPHSFHSELRVHSRGMWLWKTVELLGNLEEQDQFIAASRCAQITDIFAYLRASDYLNHDASLRAFNVKLNAAGIQIWGLEGYRGYFSDAYGPAQLYAAIDSLIAFNTRVAPEERFSGFHADMEPQDGQEAEFRPSFHNDLPDTSLNATGGGVWYSSEVWDREMLMEDWLQIYTNIKGKTKAANIRFGAAMPSWTDDYYGTPVLATFAGKRQGITQHIMDIVDDYVVMSYNTNPKNAANRILNKLIYADSLPATTRPRVYGAMETHTGVGLGVSYGDTIGKNTKATVLSDIEKIDALLKPHPSYSGMALHDWSGWKGLNP
jgi:hypothetical protein